MITFATVWAWFTDPANWQGADGVPTRMLEHLKFTGITLAIALVIAVPIGAWVGHSGRMRWLVTGANAARAIPTLGLLFAVSMLVSPLFTSSLAFTVPSIAVLVLLAIPPLLSGTYSGIESVDPAARDAARGMGMSDWEVLTRVELPCAMPLFLSGLRSATLQVIATATIAASISLGGLGRYLIDGLASQDYVQMVAGSILVALLALVADLVLALLERFAVSPGISGRGQGVARRRRLRFGRGGDAAASVKNSTDAPLGADPA
ncbi:ABC transporter permease [Humibacillus sp. DSM 29435]|uniref:ABC transporter permease n=1 Tax=Humibacillus sp. DSM 29435 TaxID=1869167 RepID=UPI000871D74D|nr:ABC transporter permease [Humibacillus sp. DSM 29435]OFE16120.1 ABC transporter permease [Humibacillus sp. DSM 29435]